ncbi:MAG: adenylate/guanylate cyclase domain-containing protein [Candidatus Puniceispirillales bacterium]
MIDIIKNLIFTPSPRYPENWKPAYLAMQLGFIAGGFGLLGRDLIIITTVENWNIIILSELFFAIFIGLGFLLHTLGFAQLGIILSCIAGIGSASSFNFLIGWSTFFHLWYINLAILIIAVPIKLKIKLGLALAFIGVYCLMFIFFSDIKPLYEISSITENILGLSNIFGSLLVLGMPMGMYSLYLEQERNKSEQLLHNIMPKAIADRLKTTNETISIDNPEISVLFADIVNFTVMSEKLSAEKIVGLLDEMFSKFDDLTEKFGIEKIKTIGDAYMVVTGLTSEEKEHAAILFEFGKELIKIASSYSDHKGEPITLRVGINSGPAVSGVIGKSKFSFDIWGDTINTAARLESYGSPGRIHMSSKTFKLINKKIKHEKRNIEIKGKGLIESILI